MNTMNMLVITALCCVFVAADAGNNNKTKTNEDQKKEQLLYEQAVKAYKLDSIATERVKFGKDTAVVSENEDSLIDKGTNIDATQQKKEKTEK